MVKNALSVMISAIIPARPRDGITHGSAMGGGAFIVWVIAPIFICSPLLILPIRVSGMLQIPEGTATMNRRYLREIVLGRRRRRGPFERPRIPRIFACRPACRQRPYNVV